MKEPISLYYRDATAADLDAIVENTITSMEYDPQWVWRFPYRKQFPEDTFKYTKYNFEAFFEQDSIWVVRVAEADDPASPGKRKVIGHGIWDLSSASKSSKNIVNNRYKDTLEARRDVDKERMLLLIEDVTKQKKTWSERWPEGYAYLSLLSVSPDYFGHGAGPALCKWGMEMAKERNVPVGLLASPMGRPVYEKLGFDTHGIMHTKGEDGTGPVLTIMGYEIQK